MNPWDMRLGRLFNKESGRGFVVAFDRGLVASVSPGGERALEVVAALSDSPADGLLLGPGLATRALQYFAHRGSPQLLVRCVLLIMDKVLPEGLAGPAEEYRVLIHPDQAAALGADAVVLFLVLGQQNQQITADNAAAVAQTVQRAHAVGLPVVVETVLWGSRVVDERDPANLAFACRQAAELGADAIKTQYSGDVASMRDIIAAVPVPVLALGGPRSDTWDAVAATTGEILTAGAHGVVYGRNIWQADNAREVASAVAAVVHGFPAAG